MLRKPEPARERLLFVPNRLCLVRHDLHDDKPGGGGRLLYLPVGVDLERGHLPAAIDLRCERCLRLSIDLDPDGFNLHPEFDLYRDADVHVPERLDGFGVKLPPEHVICAHHRLFLPGGMEPQWLDLF